ncbi:hypothetical protein CDL15_Pgr012143 [Punica granatum]|uniref:Uncharacterized protein n=1 Tax=Punica granatum TaxID=22663 RepID=A0A218XLR3_PUNGR|nr:hypothetical protein CDL15_Pgr012143 [Punica granatum]
MTQLGPHTDEAAKMVLLGFLGTEKRERRGRRVENLRQRYLGVHQTVSFLTIIVNPEVGLVVEQRDRTVKIQVGVTVISLQDNTPCDADVYAATRLVFCVWLHGNGLQLVAFRFGHEVFNPRIEK